MEASIARAFCVLKGNVRPTKDELGAVIAENNPVALLLIKDTAGLKKTKAVLMILGAICHVAKTPADARRLVLNTAAWADVLELALLPHGSSRCWGRGAAFGLAMEQARKIVEEG